MSDKFKIAIEVSENELRHLIQLHAERIGRSIFGQCTRDYMQWNAERLAALLEILKQQKAEKAEKAEKEK